MTPTKREPTLLCPRCDRPVAVHRSKLLPCRCGFRFDRGIRLAVRLKES